MASRRCVVWWGELGMLRAAHLRLLTDVEMDRRRGYVRQDDQDRFALGAVVLRLAAAAELRAEPEQLQVIRDCPHCRRPHGRPRIADADIEVSVSHAGRLVAVAVTAVEPVGVDVEHVSAVDYVPLLPHVLSARERAMVRSQEDFVVYWTRKESVVKATGAGLYTDLREVEVSPPYEAPRLLTLRSAQPAAMMADLRPGPGYAAAVSVLTAEPLSVDERSAADLLTNAT
jgi:4'-phosphopantetheinyl transferase